MHPMSINIEGEYWDSVIYKGRIHLFTVDGIIKVYDWDGIIEGLAEGCQEDEAFAIVSAFKESNVLYRSFIDRRSINTALEKLQGRRFNLTKKYLEGFLLSAHDNGFPFPHASSVFYYDRLIVSSSSGIYISEYDHVHEMRHKPSCLSDVCANQAWPSYGVLAVAAGHEGLMELPLPLNQNKSELRRLSEVHCEQCDWVYQNIIGYSTDGASTFARYKVETLEHQDDELNMDNNYERNFIEARSTDYFLPSSSPQSLTWGSRDKIFKLEGSHISVFRWTSKQTARWIGKFKLEDDLEQIVSVRTALFGIGFEYSDKLVILTSDGAAMTINEEPVNWRVFPRSRHYENHLHLIMEQGMSVLSFNQDYGVDQYHKLIGTRVPQTWTA